MFQDMTFRVVKVEERTVAVPADGDTPAVIGIDTIAIRRVRTSSLPAANPVTPAPAPVRATAGTEEVLFDDFPRPHGIAVGDLFTASFTVQTT